MERKGVAQIDDSAGVGRMTRGGTRQFPRQSLMSCSVRLVEQVAGLQRWIDRGSGGVKVVWNTSRKRRGVGEIALLPRGSGEGAQPLRDNLLAVRDVSFSGASTLSTRGYRRWLYSILRGGVV